MKTSLVTNALLKIEEDDFTVEDAHYDDQDVAETTEIDSNDHGYDSDKENDHDADDGWSAPGNLKSKMTASYERVQ